MTGILEAPGSSHALSPLSCYFPYKNKADALGWGLHRKTKSTSQKIWIFWLAIETGSKPPSEWKTVLENLPLQQAMKQACLSALSCGLCWVDGFHLSCWTMTSSIPAPCKQKTASALSVSTEAWPLQRKIHSSRTAWLTSASHKGNIMLYFTEPYERIFLFQTKKTDKP